MSQASAPLSSFDEGEEVYLGFGNKLTFYPLTWGVRKRLRKQFEVAFSGTPSLTGDWQDAAVVILHASAARGKPDLTLEQVEDMIDMRNLSACMRALGIASSLKGAVNEESAADEKGASDEPRPTVSPSGQNSTPPSSPTLDGPSSSVTH